MLSMAPSYPAAPVANRANPTRVRDHHASPRSLHVGARGYPSDMTDQNTSAAKPTEEWVTGDEPLTGPQASYLETLAREAGETVPDNLTKAQEAGGIERREV